VLPRTVRYALFFVLPEIRSIGDRSLSISNLRKRLPSAVTIVEVGPRDGLQNQPQKVPTHLKIGFIERLVAAGLKVIEVTSFVNPKWVPQLADASDVIAALPKREGVRFPVLVPNEEGLERALEAGVQEVAVFASATETFSQKNLNRSRQEAIDMFRPVVKTAKESGMRVRGYLSMVLGDPWEGDVDPREVVSQTERLIELGCDEISLGDTIGVGTAGQVQDLIAKLLRAGVKVETLAVHFHDTYGQGLANVLAALETGVTIVDSSAGGLGGCPFARSATGNLATEDLLWLLEGLAIPTGIDVRAVASASKWLCDQAQIPMPGRVARALTS
jgi:hydroxymethylglutaryl-CoA lyase